MKFRNSKDFSFSTIPWHNNSSYKCLKTSLLARFLKYLEIHDVPLLLATLTYQNVNIVSKPTNFCLQIYKSSDASIRHYEIRGYIEGNLLSRKICHMDKRVIEWCKDMCYTEHIFPISNLPNKTKYKLNISTSFLSMERAMLTLFRLMW